MLHKILGKNYARKHWLKKTKSPEMKAYLSIALNNGRQLLKDIKIVSLDIETTGLNSDNDRIVSIGLVEISHLGIALNSCWHKIIHATTDLPESSIVIHNITDDDSAAGVSIKTAIEELLIILEGKVVLVHNSNVEQRFLNVLCQKMYGADLVMRIIDTQALAKRSFERQNISYKPNELRLFNLRKKFNMPAYKAHNALLDALATAELFLAMVNNISSEKDARLSDFLS